MSMKLICAFVILAVLGQASSLLIEAGLGIVDGDNPVWEAFKTKFNKTYDSVEEELRRYQIYAALLLEIDAHNADSSNTWTKGVNFFSDLTSEEFMSTYLGATPPSEPNSGTKAYSEFNRTQTRALPTVANWVTQGKVTPVKNQGGCGSCWAFSTTGALEGSNAIYGNGQLIQLSEEFLVDCNTGSNGNWGCSGGWPSTAMNFIQSAGIPTEQTYPYTAGNTGTAGTCQNLPTSGVRIISIANNGGSEYTLQVMVAYEGPTSVCLDARYFQSYTGGIMNIQGCYQNTNHCILAIGYDENAGIWIMKNQWGTGWGENGFIRMALGSNMCGLANYGYFPFAPFTLTYDFGM